MKSGIRKSCSFSSPNAAAESFGTASSAMQWNPSSWFLEPSRKAISMVTASSSSWRCKAATNALLCAKPS